MISVIVPAYNLEKYIARTLDSILAQTYADIEIIVVDDGSTDGTRKILQQYEREYPAIRVIYKENGGVTSARLCGIREATGDWIGFVDGDDEIEPDMYGRLLKNAVEHKADISHCGYQMVFADGRVHYFHNTRTLEVHSRIQALRELLSGERIEPGLCNKLFNKTLFYGLLHGETMPLDIKINEDLLMNYHLFSAAENAVFDDWCPYHYIVRSTSASRSKLNDHKIYDPVRVKEIILADVPEELKDDAQRAYMATCIYIYSGLVLEGGTQRKQDRAAILRMLTSHSSWARHLGIRQRILYGIIRWAPFAYPAIYKWYAANVQKKKYG